MRADDLLVTLTADRTSTIPNVGSHRTELKDHADHPLPSITRTEIAPLASKTAR